MGIIAQNGHITDLKLRASLNFGGLVSQIATIAAGILGIAASVEPNLWFIVSVCFDLNILKYLFSNYPFIYFSS